MVKICVNSRFVCIVSIVIFLLISIMTLRMIYGNSILKQLNNTEISLKNAPNDQTIWFIGDSRIARWPINEIFNHRDSILNLGIEGHTSNESLSVLIKSLNFSKPRFIFVQVGINDLKAIGVYPDKQNQITNSVIENIKSILLLSIENDIIPVYCTIFPTGKVEFKRLPFWNRKINSSLINVNQMIVDFCKSNKILVFNSYDLLINENGKVQKTYQEDCFHLNSEGYRHLNKEMYKFIKINLSPLE